MKELISLTNLRAAQALCDYLTHNGIENLIDNFSGRYIIGVVDPDDYDKARAIADEFLSEPNQKKFLEASWLVDNHNQPYTHKPSINKGFVLPGLKDIKSQWLTYGLILLSILIYFGARSGLFPFLYPLLSFPAHIESLGLIEALRFITPAFLHFSVMHIVFNLLWWWQFGGSIEREQGSQRLLLLFLLTSLASNLAQDLVTGPNFGGLSGVVYGLLGYLWIYKKLNFDSPLFVHPQIVTFMLIWLVIGYTDILSSLIGPVANWAHSIGLLSGCLLGAFFSMWDLKKTSL